MSELFPNLVKWLVKLCLSGTRRQTKNAAIILAITGCTKECENILQVPLYRKTNISDFDVKFNS